MYADKVVPALQTWLESHRSTLDERVFKPYRTKLGKIYPFESQNIPSSAMPCLELGTVSWKKSWVASGFMLEDVYQLAITGYVLWTDSEENAKLILAFASEVSRLFELIAGQDIPVEGTNFRIHYHSEMPLASGEIDYTLIGDAFVRSFRYEWVGYITRQAEIGESYCIDEP